MAPPALFHNARLKHYPDGSGELLVGSRPFGGGSRVDALPWKSSAGDGDRAEILYARMERDAIALGDRAGDLDADPFGTRAASVRRSVRRAKKCVRDLARSNEWRFFVTLTLDPEKVDRYDPDAVLRHLKHWLDNNVRRKGLRYVLVPEHHKDGAIHFHGLFNDALDAVDSGTMSVPGRKAPVRVRSEAHRAALERLGGHTVYNLPGWGWGFSTAIELYGERDAAISYVCKYIGKEMSAGDGLGDVLPSKIGGRWYYSGGDLQRPVVEWLDVDIRDWEDTPGWFQPEGFDGASFLCLRISSDGEIIPPYVSPAVDSQGSGAERGRGGDHPAKRGVTTAPEPSADRADSSSSDRQTARASAQVRPQPAPALATRSPSQAPQEWEQLTFLGLSNRPDSPSPWASPGRGRRK